MNYKRLTLFLVLTFISLYIKTYGATIDEYRNLISQNSVVIGFIRFGDIKSPIIPSELTNFADTNKHILFNVNDKGLTITYLPINTNWGNLVTNISNKEILSDQSILITTDKFGKFYIKKEENNFIAIVPPDLINNYNNLNKGLDKETESKLSPLFEQALSSNLTLVFAKLPENIKNLLKSNIPIIDNKYNLLLDIDYGYLFFNMNQVKLYGKVFFKDSKNLKNIYTPRSIRGVNVISDEIPFSINTSLNPEIFGDILEALYPDIIQTFPYLKSSIYKSLSGTIFLILHSPIYQNDLDITIFLGIKSKSEAEKLVKNLLGLTQSYEPLTILGKRVLEIELKEQNLNLYLYLSKKEIVITTTKNRMEEYLNLSENQTSLEKDFPTLKIQGKINYITPRDREELKEITGLEIDSINIYIDIKDDLKSMDFEISK